jgi:hypothetical protein
MLVRNFKGSALAALPVFIIFISFCALPGSFSYAAQAEEDVATAEAAPGGEPATDEQSAANEGEQPAAAANEGEAAKDAAAARLEEIQKQNKKCLMCHNREKTKLLEDGKEMSLQVPKEPYLASAHGAISCVSCHKAIGKIKHPSKDTNISIASEREFSLELNESCRKCHLQKYKQYKTSVHAALVAQGNPKAPVCSSCHNPHAPVSMAHYETEAGPPCKKCHESIYNAYAASVHGQARLHGNTIRDSHIQAPICSDCHHSHAVTPLAIGDVLRTTCIACHENVTLLHNQWLPNAGTHLDIVSCAVCHAPFAQRTFDLHLYDNTAGAPLAVEEGDTPIQEQLRAIAEEGGTGDPLEIWKERAGLGQDGKTRDISLRSRMEVMSGVAAHQIASKSFAVRTCESCHEPGWRQKQNITLTITTPEGMKQSFEADREVLSSVKAVESISDFYALGGNPNKILDILLLMSLAAGIAVPIGHFTLGKMIKEYMERGAR